MKFIWKGNLTQNFKVFINRLGYHQQMDRNSGQVSYIKRLGRLFYPRFHLYIDQEDGKIIFKLHLDEKKASTKVVIGILDNMKVSWLKKKCIESYQ